MSLIRRLLPLACFVITAVFVFTVISPDCAKAQEPISQLKTRTGILLARSATGLDCPKYLSLGCEVISLNGKILFANAYAYIASVYPSSTNPKLVVIAESAGGNCCPPSTHLIDFSASPPIIASDDTLSSQPKFSEGEGGVVVEQYAGADDLGDQLWGVFHYQWGSGRFVLIRKSPIYSTTPLRQKEYADDVLGDPTLREPILRVVGKDYFAKFRFAMLTSSPDQLRVVGDRFVVGSGCMPHSCNSNGAIFVIDLLRKTAWAVEGESLGMARSQMKARLWGNLSKEDAIPSRVLGEWLTKHSMSWNMVALMPVLPQASLGTPEQFPRHDTDLNISGKGGISSSANTNAELGPSIQNFSPKTGVSLKTDGGILVVPVEINGAMTLDFVVDSGASYVSVPADVFSTLRRTGTIQVTDIIGKQTFVLADGSKSQSDTFTIKSLKVGDIVVKNVKGSIAPSQGSLLLGQSFLERFRSWSIDNTTKELLLEPK